MLLWNLGSVQGRPGAQGFRKLAPLRMSAFISYHLLSQATLRALPDKSPSQSATQLRETITEAVMLIKNVYETACKETWSIAAPLIAGHTGFFRQESVLLLHSKTSGFSAGTFNATCYSRGWRGSGLPYLFAVGTSAGGTSHWNKLEIRKYQVTYLLPACMKVPHLISTRPMEFDHICCKVILAGGHTSDCHLAIQFVG